MQSAESFKDWFINSFLHLLEEGSIIIMDNASYHSRVINKPPSRNTRKADIQEWLQQNNIKYHPFETIIELLHKVKQYKSVVNIYELDQLASERGHEIICLPPYHCQYNPTELIWAKVKGEVAAENN